MIAPDVARILDKLAAADGDTRVLTFEESRRLLDMIAVRQEHDDSCLGHWRAA